MKLIYSNLKQLLPDLLASPKQLASDLAMIGHFVAGIETTKDDTVLDLDIKVNRGDCLGYYGLARDLSVLYDIPLTLPHTIHYPLTTNYCLPITVTATSDVSRIQALKISNLKNSPSPDWLRQFLEHHQINSINTLVDLTNYVMLIWGIPNHAFDTAKSTNNLVWELNSNYAEFTTLDNVTLKLKPGILMINNPQKPLSLSFLGGQACAIDLHTTETIIEMAVYNRVRVRQDSRFLKTATEASTRLEKDLDPDTIPLALNHLASLILEHCGGQISSQLFDYYPKPQIISPITLDLSKPSAISGINIPTDFSIKTLQQLGCTLSPPFIKGGDKGVGFTPPTIRKDLELEEDLVEEIVRFYGYQHIPLDQPISSDKLPDITPKVLTLIDQLKNQLVALGYDEVRSWPLVQSPTDQNTAIYTQNSINSEYPVLRQSIIQSLKSQLDQYNRLKLYQQQFFEVGKIFSKIGDKYIEKYSLGISSYDNYRLIKDVENIFKIKFSSLNSEKVQNQIFAEIILSVETFCKTSLPNNKTNTAYELTSQIITLDANVTLDSPCDPLDLIREYQDKIGKDHLWQILITDIYQNKYTFRVSYFNISDDEAKKLHLQTFGFQYTSKVNIDTANIDPKSPTDLVYYQDMYQTSLEAKIIATKQIKNKYYLILDKTIFFPEGGGQPSDIGIIQGQKHLAHIKHAIYQDSQVLHQTGDKNLKIGETVKCTIDWDYRYKYMKIHSAGHLLHEVLMTLSSDLKPLKGSHGDSAYLIYSGYIDPAKLSDIQIATQTKIKENLPIICQYTTPEELAKTARSVPANLPKNKQLRMLQIGDYPSMADGGIQVKSTEEIGKITITKIDNSNNQVTIYYTT